MDNLWGNEYQGKIHHPNKESLAIRSKCKIKVKIWCKKEKKLISNEESNIAYGTDNCSFPTKKVIIHIPNRSSTDKRRWIIIYIMFFLTND
jgi:hypothetical protein